MRKAKRYEEGGDVDPLEAANNSKESQEIAGEAMLKGMRDTEAAPRRAPIVTKEQLAASGLSLRDYLNKQQGLTRRGESAPMASAPKAAPKETMVEKTVVKTEPAKSTGPRVGRASQSTAVEPDRAPMGGAPVNAAKQAKFRESLTDSPLVNMFKAIRARGEETAPKGYAKGGDIKHYPSAAAAVKAAQKRGDKGISVKFSSGGSVSSASKRGDGIAQKGKTRGKMC
jgi:hypothetical protein